MRQSIVSLEVLQLFLPNLVSFKILFSTRKLLHQTGHNTTIKAVLSANLFQLLINIENGPHVIQHYSITVSNWQFVKLPLQGWDQLLTVVVLFIEDSNQLVKVIDGLTHLLSWGFLRVASKAAAFL